MSGLHTSIAHAAAVPPWEEILGYAPGRTAAAKLRDQQLTDLNKRAALLVLLFLSHACALTYKLQGTAFANLAILWFALHLVMMIWAIVAALRNARVAADAPMTLARVRRVVGGITLLALLWNAIFLAVGGGLDPGTTIALSGIHLALVGAGPLLLAPVPAAALIYLVIFVSAHAILASISVVQGVTPGYVVILIGIVALAIARGIIGEARSRARLVASGEALREHGQMVDMLLAEYERSGSDWLWTTDRHHNCVHVSPVFAKMMGVRHEDMLGASMIKTPPGMQSDATPFESALLRCETFRQLEIPVVLPSGDRRVWTISGTPRYDDDGQFAGFSGMGSDVTEARRARAQIERMATADGLTGLPNRATLRGHIQAAIDVAMGGASGGCALMLIDLDRFKNVNDTLGHGAGDELLRQVADRLLKRLEHGGIAARLGGDEFSVVLSGVSATAARAVASGIIEHLSEPFTLRDGPVQIGASVGVAMAPADGDTIDALMRAADLALYRAKDDGRGRVRLYDATLQEDAAARVKMEEALRGALAAEQFSLNFQPIFEVEPGAVVGFEALLRWYHPELGHVSPARFIPVAEELGLMDTIGAWVLRTACAWARHWPENVGLSVNLSPSQLANPALPGIVLGALSANQITPSRLELEVTENVFLTETDVTRASLDALARLGVRIGLDDFGTGYSSLAYLRTTAFHTIKIDRCFVRDAVDANSQSATIVRHIVSLAASLGMETVAEGAESAVELEAIRLLGCSRVQGYYTGRPMAPEAALALATDATQSAAIAA